MERKAINNSQESIVRIAIDKTQTERGREKLRGALLGCTCSEHCTLYRLCVLVYV